MARMAGRRESASAVCASERPSAAPKGEPLRLEGAQGRRLLQLEDRLAGWEGKGQRRGAGKALLAPRSRPQPDQKGRGHEEPGARARRLKPAAADHAVS